jgi:outer membrane murein-binding lipoprotein Lpp
MSLPEWSLVIGVVISVALAIGPWMFKVHAKLEVIASKVVDLCDKMDRATDDNARLREICFAHQSRLDTHDVKLTHIAERLRRD